MTVSFIPASVGNLAKFAINETDSELKHVFLMTSLWGWDVAAGTDVVCQNNADLVVIPEG